MHNLLGIQSDPNEKQLLNASVVKSSAREKIRKKNLM